jgi:CheY-like chemotaxis protein/glycine cleavage system H lipoate-binding protein
MKVIDLFIIDDEQVVIDSIIKIGELNNYTFDFASDAISGLNKLKLCSFKLIICDIMLYEMDGFQFVSELQKLNIDTPVVMTTGYSTLENAVKSLSLGAIDFIPKPFTFDEVASVIKRCMKYYNIQDEEKKSGEKLIYVPCPSKYYRLGYSCWINKDYDGSVLFGATDLYIKSLENIKSIELLDINETINQGLPICKLITEDGSAHNLYSALSGRIIESNESLLSNINLLEKDPYFKGWLYRILPSELEHEMNMLIPCSSDR